MTREPIFNAGREPVFNAPPSVVRCLLVLLVIHVVLWHVLDEDTAAWLLGALAFIPTRYSGEAAFLPGGTFLGGWGAAVWTFVTHQLLHGDWTHIALNSLWLLVFGGAIAARIGGWRFLAFGLLSGVAGALMFLAFRFGDRVPMIGASGAVSGLMGGSFRFLFAALDRGGFEMFRNNPRGIPLMSVAETLRDHRLQIAAGVLIAINVLTIFVTPSISSADGVAWQSHLGGFLFGLFAFQFFDPPGRPKLQIVRPTLH